MGHLLIDFWGEATQGEAKSRCVHNFCVVGELDNEIKFPISVNQGPWLEPDPVFPTRVLSHPLRVASAKFQK
jgi:hypothetical protein